MLYQANLTKRILLSLLVLSLISCGRNNNTDHLDSLSRKNMGEVLIKNTKADKLKKAAKSSDEVPVPNISKLILSPPPPAIGGDKTISFSVTEKVPLKDVLIELGRITEIDIDLDTNISGGIILNAKNRPLKEVIDRIASLGSLRYSYKNGVLHFERDAPYMKNYFVDYLVDGTVWTDVEANISAVLAANEPQISTSSSDESGEESVSPTSSTAASTTSNKSAGIISVVATDRQHHAVAAYLADVEKYASAQVLIEAKVVDVGLSNEFKTGVDWSLLAKVGGASIGKIAQTGTNIAGNLSLPLGSTVKKLFGGDMTGTINLLEKFGSTKTLSSPRIHATNNQKATISFTNKLVYFSITNTQTGSTTQNANVVSTQSSTKQEETVGIQLEITPSINLKTSEITMSIKPKITDSTKSAKDPVNNGNEVPIIESRELSTIAKIESGNVLVIGGLMKDNSSRNEVGVPWLQRLPIIGWFFKSDSRASSITETIIFIKATIVNSSSQASKTDHEIQEKFDVNKRSFFGQ